jgi:hypothetical protein
MAILELHHFRLPVCRFVIDLFDKRVMRQIVLEEEEEDEDDESNADGGDSDSDEDLPNGTPASST